jgi:tetratricopeptide (TPR) repeat protein
MTAFVMAESNFGIDHYKLGEINLAKAWFEQHLNESPAEAYYYLGEIAWDQGNPTLAKEYYEKGLAADPTYYFNLIGKGKVLFKSDPKEAEVLFATVLKKYKKNVPYLLAISKAYRDNGMTVKADEILALARKSGKNSPDLFIYEGDQLLKSDQEGKLGAAASKYEQAFYFDPSNTVAKIKYAQVYQQINPNLSIETLKKVIEEHPDYLIATRELATSYSKAGIYAQALELFKKYFAAGNYNIEDITRFASVYYFTDQYEESLKLVNEGLAIDSMHFVLNRLRMYNANKMKDVENGLKAAERFFSLRSGTGNSEESHFIYQDYLAYASLLTDAGRYTEALSQFDKILSMDDPKIDKAAVYKEMASCYSKMKAYPKAAEAHENYIKMLGIDYAEATAYFQLGMSYYLAAQALRSDSTETGKLKLKEYVIKADSAFFNTCRLSPDSYVGYMWRGNVNTLLDPESTEGIAKPYYEEAIQVIMKKIEGGDPIDSYKKPLITCYNYLGYYYYLKNDKANSSIYWQKILELDPTNANAKMVLDAFKAEEANSTKK